MSAQKNASILFDQAPGRQKTFELAKTQLTDPIPMQKKSRAKEPSFSLKLFPHLHKQDDEIKHSFIMDFKLDF